MFKASVIGLTSVFIVIGVQPASAESPRGHETPSPPRSAAAIAEPKLAGRTVQLEFKLLPENTDATPLIVLVADGKYSVRHDSRTSDSVLSTMINGGLQSAGDSSQILLSYQATHSHLQKSADIEHQFSASGSAMIELAKTVTLCRLGEKSLTVTATADRDATKPPSSIRSLLGRITDSENRLIWAQGKEKKQIRIHATRTDPHRPPAKPSIHLHHNGCSNIIVFTISGTTNISKSESQDDNDDEDDDDDD